MQIISKRSRPAVAALILVLSLILSGHVFAQQRSADEVSRITRDVSQEIFSPYCPGKTLAMCPSGNAADARREVQSMAEQGMDKEAIKDELISRYGEEFRVVEPPPEDNYKLFGAVVASFGLFIFAVAALVRKRRGADGELLSDGLYPDDFDDENAETDGYLEDLRAEYQD